MPTRGTRIIVDGYGSGIFAGAHDLDDDENAGILMKFEGIKELEEGYGRGIISVPLDEYKENRIHPEQLPKGQDPNVSTHKRDKILKKRMEDIKE